MYILQNVLLVISMQLLEKTLKFEFTHLTLNICRIYVEILKNKKIYRKDFFLNISHQKMSTTDTCKTLFYMLYCFKCNTCRYLYCKQLQKLKFLPNLVVQQT